MKLVALFLVLLMAFSLCLPVPASAGLCDCGEGDECITCGWYWMGGYMQVLLVSYAKIFWVRYVDAGENWV